MARRPAPPYSALFVVPQQCCRHRVLCSPAQPAATLTIPESTPTSYSRPSIILHCVPPSGAVTVASPRLAGPPSGQRAARRYTHGFPKSGTSHHRKTQTPDLQTLNPNLSPKSSPELGKMTRHVRRQPHHSILGSKIECWWLWLLDCLVGVQCPQLATLQLSAH